MKAGSLLLSLVLAVGPHAVASAQGKARSYTEILATATNADWRPVDPEHTYYLDLPQGRVIFEVSPQHAPRHAANLRALVAEKYFDGLAIVRSQDNYVVQWGDPDEKNPRPMKGAKAKLAPEFSRAFAAPGDMPPFTRLPDVDGYAREVGFSNGFPVARDPAKNEAWLAHCYGMVGAGRDNAADSGSGAELYVVTGHAPRHLDRNVTLLGRVVQGMPLLSALPRGSGPLGFYETAQQRVPIKALRRAADLPPAERVPVEVIRTDTPLFALLVEALRNRGGDWYKVAAGHIELCNVALATRIAK
ncbi:MAG TPA: peptidylprolyl isomerase [Usitatibacteraceae bacterium]|nr:peptidylprolyl isomerase [Usitatibacteraceae bacterium]